MIESATTPPSAVTDDGENRAPGKTTSLKYTYKDGKFLVIDISPWKFFISSVFRPMESSKSGGQKDLRSTFSVGASK